jgi:hypothetical protein
MMKLDNYQNKLVVLNQINDLNLDAIQMISI